MLASLGEPAGILFVTEVLLGLHLTAYYSLRVSRGALVLAIVTIILGNLLGVMALSLLARSSNPEGELIIPIAVLLLAGCVALQFAIAQRIRVLVAED